MKPIFLNKLELVQQIDENTPCCVIEEIAITHGLKYKSKQLNNIKYVKLLIQILTNNEIESIILPISEKKDLRLLARFVNPYVEWTTEDLIQSFHSILTFMNDPTWNNLPTGELGFPTPEKYNNILPSMLYRLGRDYGISMNLGMDINEMYDLVELGHQNIILHRNNILRKIENVESLEILNELSIFLDNNLKKKNNLICIHEICTFIKKRNKSFPSELNNQSSSSPSSSSHQIVSSHQILSSPSSSHQILSSPSSSHQILSPPSSSHQIVSPPSSSHQIVSPPSSSPQILSPSSSSHQIVSPYSSSHQIMSPPSSLENSSLFLGYKYIPPSPVLNGNVDIDNYSLQPDIIASINFQKMNELAINYNNMKKTWGGNWKPGLPGNIEQTIALAAIAYKLDFSKVKDPIREYRELTKYATMDMKGNINYNSYEPLDYILKTRWYSNNKEIDSPCLFECFNPKLPRSFYTYPMLCELSLKQGYNNEDILMDDPYVLLQTNCLLPTFYTGFQKKIRNKRTYITLDNINDINEDTVVCYGVRNESMDLFCYDELKELFESNKAFIHPVDNSNFSDIAIRKLFKICDINELKNIIDIVRDYQENMDDYTKQLLELYQKEDVSIQKLIIKTLRSLEHLSMYMRGWNKNDMYPTKEALVNDQLLVDLNVTNGFVEWENNCKSLSKYFDICNLPLMRYRENKFIRSNNSDDGLTIGERLYIVKKNDNITSCIRMSSNWLASSSYYYLYLLKAKLNYDIKDLANIA
jgi:hypothetical protein